MVDFAKIIYQGELEVLTGLHIGASSAFSAIGATDSPIIKNPITGLPIIPGSSLKGKMRSLLAKAYNEKPAKSPSEDDFKILRLFGSADHEEFKTGRLIFRDTELSNEEELFKKNVDTLTEVKFENTIDRYTAMAMPRQIERSIAGSKFNFEIVYEINNQGVDEIKIDHQLIIDGLKLLELDYIGGNGSRGYGQIKFNNMRVVKAYGDIETDIIDELNTSFE